ncbi:TPA: hypothetical protein PW898_001709, partial [Mannheimia haemolytica]|nr:hypothetical protein [Mannheimia haemolytica]
MTTQVTPQIMRIIGQIVAATYGDDVPTNVQTIILRYPIRGIGFISSRRELSINNGEIARLMDKIPGDLEDPKDGMPFDCQGAFWLGYYQYCKLSNDVKNYTSKELSIIGESLYGTQWQSNLARDLRLSDARRVREWVAGERKIPFGVWADLTELVKAKKANLSSILKKL